MFLAGCETAKVGMRIPISEGGSVEVAYAGGGAPVMNSVGSIQIRHASFISMLPGIS